MLYLQKIKRITPAYAGKSNNEFKPRRFDRDHPRLCGEKSPVRANTCPVRGSPPPMRGKVRFQRFQTAVIEDHPRLCGEKWTKSKRATFGRGSPPPMRGKVSKPLDVIGTPGITPAYAGKSDIDSPDFSRSKDHPRLCGEKSFGWLTTAAGKGSPPPMRGKGLYIHHRRTYARITPAYAGKRSGLCMRGLPT